MDVQQQTVAVPASPSVGFGDLHPLVEEPGMARLVEKIAPWTAAVLLRPVSVASWLCRHPTELPEEDLKMAEEAGRKPESSPLLAPWLISALQADTARGSSHRTRCRGQSPSPQGFPQA